MKIEYLHASKFGNGRKVAYEFKDQMAARGVSVMVHHIRETKAKDLPQADLYVFSSPTRMGKPIRGMRRFLRRVDLPAGTKYALLATELAARPDKRTGRMPSDEELAEWHRTVPIMNEVLRAKGLVEVADDRVLVTDVKGPLEEGWESKVAAFVGRLTAEAAAA